MGKINVLVVPESIWQYYTSHKKELKKSTKLVACNEDFDIEIHITDEDGVLNAMVYLSNVEVARKEITDSASANGVMTGMYQKYIFGAKDFIDSRQQEIDEADEQDMIGVREMELDDAIYDVLDTFCGSAFDFRYDGTQELFENLKDVICETLYAEYGIEVYRPMYLEDDDGNKEFCLYPYAELIG